MAEKKQIKENYWLGLGRRKTAVARVKLTKGSGQFIINGKEVASPSRVYLEPLKIAGLEKKFNVEAQTSGGGIQAQAEALRLGIARALVNSENELKTTLKKEKYLTRDPRMKERKKPGLKGARRAPQWQKR
jgi:small subunit ribosomal protein S9